MLKDPITNRTHLCMLMAAYEVIIVRWAHLPGISGVSTGTSNFAPELVGLGRFECLTKNRDNDACNWRTSNSNSNVLSTTMIGWLRKASRKTSTGIWPHWWPQRYSNVVTDCVQIGKNTCGQVQLPTVHVQSEGQAGHTCLRESWYRPQHPTNTLVSRTSCLPRHHIKRFQAPTPRRGHWCARWRGHLRARWRGRWHDRWRGRWRRSRRRACWRR